MALMGLLESAVSGGAEAASCAGSLVLGAGGRLSLSERFVGESAQIDGEVAGSLKVTRFTLGRNGVFRGHVSCDSAQIRGRFEGELRVKGKLIVFASGRAEGKLRFGDIQVWKGGTVAGNVMRHHQECPTPISRSRHRAALFMPTMAVLSNSVQDPLSIQAA
jgi:cytoskeletal protein CcmA (bactofilin family)